MAARRGGGEGREWGGWRSAVGGSRAHGAREDEPGTAAAGCETGEGGTGAVGAASGPAGGSGDGGDKGVGSGSCGRTGRDAGAWALVLPSPRGLCGAGWLGAGCGR